MKDYILKIDTLTKTFDKKTILNGVNLEIKPSEVISLVGPSGEGKSTLLRCIAGLEGYSKGIIKINGNVGMVFQAYNLFPNLTVLNNIALALQQVNKQSRESAIYRAETELKKMGLLDKANMYPSQLSGGQAQRVAIARALALDPSLLLFDEPTSALDSTLKKEVLNIIKKVATQNSCSIIIVTHELDFAKKISDRIILLRNGLLENL